MTLDEYKTHLENAIARVEQFRETRQVPESVPAILRKGGSSYTIIPGDVRFTNEDIDQNVPDASEEVTTYRDNIKDVIASLPADASIHYVRHLAFLVKAAISEQ